MFDQLFEESPMIQQMREQSRAEGIQEGIQEGLQALQHSLVTVVGAKYPDLAEFAQQQVGHFNKPAVLDLLIQKVVTAPNASTVRWLLESGAGM